jgi:hypothetical protein
MSAEIKLVTAASALQWLRGEIDDAGLVAGEEVVFWAELPRRADYREALKIIKAFRAAGLKSMVARACHPSVTHKLAREGALKLLTEPRFFGGREIIAARFWVSPDVFRAWTNKFS